MQLRMTIDGAEVPNDLYSVEYEGQVKAGGGTLPSTDLTFTLDVDASSALRRALIWTSRGASAWTLARRTLYGGRKGRNAWRRLCASGFTAIVKWSPDTRFAMPVCGEPKGVYALRLKRGQ